jgi:hypothetical protein
MRSPCSCGGPARYRLYDVTCLECGMPCCPSCTFIFESATYCARCAESILEIADMGWSAPSEDVFQAMTVVTGVDRARNAR